MSCCCGALLRRVRRDGEPAAEAARKALLVPVAAGVSTLTLGGVVVFLSQLAASGGGEGNGQSGGMEEDALRQPVWALYYIFVGLGADILVFRALITRSLPIVWCEVSLVLAALGVLAHDFLILAVSKGQGTPYWPLSMLVLDSLLVIDARKAVSILVCVIVTMYLLAKESYMGFVILKDDCITCEFPGWHFGGIVSWLIAKTLLPFILTASVTLLDFRFTRGFAQGMRDREAALEASICAAENVGHKLTQYDTDAAHELIVSEGRALPPRLHGALCQLIANLRAYKPYLPQSVRGENRGAITLEDDSSSGRSWGSASGSDSARGGRYRRSRSPRAAEPSNSSGGGSCASSCASSAHSRAPSPHSGPPTNKQESHADSAQTRGVVFAFDTRPHSAGRQPQLTQAASQGRMAPDAVGRRSSIVPSPLAAGGRRVSQHGAARPQSAALGNAGSFGGATAVRGKDTGVRIQVKAPRPRGPVPDVPAGLLDGGVVPRPGAPWPTSPVTPVAVAAEPKAKAVSLVSSNRRGFLPAGRQVPAATVSAWMEHVVAIAASVVKMQKGIIDTISADHILSSFGTVRPCGAHRLAAARCANAASDVAAASTAWGALAGLRVSSAACSGSALCGDFGSKDQQRYMVIGGVSSLVWAAERLATQWGVAALLDAPVHSSSEAAWDCRHRGVVIYAKRGSEEPIALFEMVAEREDEEERCEAAADDDPRHGQEWMYAVGRRAPGAWDEHNHAMRLWAGGECAQAQRAAGAAAEAAANAAVRGAALALRVRITDAALPPLVVSEVVAERAAAPPAPPALRTPLTAADVLDEHRRQEAEQQRVLGAEREAQARRLESRVRHRQDARSGTAATDGTASAAPGAGDAPGATMSSTRSDGWGSGRAAAGREPGAAPARSVHANRAVRSVNASGLSARGGSSLPPAGEAVTPLRFADVAEGMAIKMTPEGCDVGREFYIGVVTYKQTIDGYKGHPASLRAHPVHGMCDLVCVQWDEAGSGGPPDSLWQYPPDRPERPRDRPERRQWWDTDGFPQLIRPEDQPEVQLAEI